MTRAEIELRRRLARQVDSYDNADAPIAVSPAKTTLQATQGNPAFTAQFDVQFILKFYTVASGAYTSIAASALDSSLKTKLNAFLFGNSDFSSGFAKLQSQFPLQGWTYGDPFVYGKNYPIVNGVALTSTVTNQFVKGDVIIPYYATVSSTAYQGFVIIRCTQVAYATLLDATNSDRFTMNMIRYIMSDTSSTGLAQYNNNIFIMKQSLFGKFDSDFVSPNSFKLPEQMQDGVIDIPVTKGIDKQIALASSINYDVAQVQWSIFVETVNKLAY